MLARGADETGKFRFDVVFAGDDVRLRFAVGCLFSTRCLFRAPSLFLGACGCFPDFVRFDLFVVPEAPS